MSNPLKKFKNYLEIANTNMRNQNLYFFLKNYAFTNAYNSLQNDSSDVTESDKKTFDYLSQEFNKEKQLFGYNGNMSKEEYQNFLEYFYGQIDFDNANIEKIEICRDMIEIFYVFGDLDELSKRRSKINIIFYFLVDYFTKKIQLMQPDYYINAYKNKHTNILSAFEPRTEQKLVSTGPSKSLDEFPDVKDDAHNFSYKKMDSVQLDYIPKLVDKSIRLPISKNSSEYNKVKELIKMHIEYSSLELDFHKLDIAKDHVEAAIYYLRNIN